MTAASAVLRSSVVVATAAILTASLLPACERQQVHRSRLISRSLRPIPVLDSGVRQRRSDCIEEEYGEIRSADGMQVFAQSIDRLHPTTHDRLRRFVSEELIEQSLVETCADDPIPWSGWFDAAYRATEHCVRTFATTQEDADRIARNSRRIVIAPDGSVVPIERHDESEFAQCISATLASFRGPRTGLCRQVIAHFPRCPHVWFRRLEPGGDVELYEFRDGQAIAAWRNDAGR